MEDRVPFSPHPPLFNYGIASVKNLLNELTGDIVAILRNAELCKPDGSRQLHAVIQ